VSRIGADIARALDPAELARGVGMDPDPWQAEALRSTHPRQLYNCCRQSGKSQTAAVLATHVSVYEPGALVLLLSPSQRQSGELFRKVLAVYKTLGRPVPSESENALSPTLENGSRVVSLPGSEATIRSYSAVRLLICDESSRILDETYSAVRPMLAVNARAQVVALSTPAGRRGWWHRAWEDEGATWERVRVPATDVPRISAAFLAEEKASMGEYFYRQEYCCEFAESDAQLISEATLKAMWSARCAPPLFPEG
jgi:hypothetical protein